MHLGTRLVTSWLGIAFAVAFVYYAPNTAADVLEQVGGLLAALFAGLEEFVRAF